MTQEHQPAFNVEKVDQLLANVKSIEDLTGPNGVLKEMLKSTIERILKAEQEAHLGYEPYASEGINSGNSRNGYSKKTVKTSSGTVEVNVPRDRNGTFEPKFLEKHKKFDPTLEKQIVGMYARGVSVRDIQTQLQEHYGTEISPAYVSKVTEHLLDGIEEWQSRPLDSVYPVVFLDAIHFKIRHDGKIKNRAAYTCMGINLDGDVDVLGLWISENEGSHFWQSVLNDLRGRGVEDILIACVDGLKGFPEAIAAIFPRTLVQQCIVHQIRTSLRFTASKNHKEIVQDMKEIYNAINLEAAEEKLNQFSEKWEDKASAAVKSWNENWDCLSTFFMFPAEVRKMIYTTNSVEALHRQFRKVTKSKGSFPSDQALKKMLYLAILGIKNRKKRDWSLILCQLKNYFGERIP